MALTIDHNSCQSFVSTITSTGLALPNKSIKFKFIIMPVLPKKEHSEKRGITTTINKLVKF